MTDFSEEFNNSLNKLNKDSNTILNKEIINKKSDQD